MKGVFLVLCIVVAVVSATTYFKEDFGAGWEKRWVKSSFKGASAGDLVQEGDGVKTATDARFYQYSAAFPDFSNKGKTLVFQFSVKNAQNIDCGGAYFKLLPKGVAGPKYNGDDSYNLMFGPDICGATKKTHAIIAYKGKNVDRTDQVTTKTDTLSHVYTWIINADNTYKILIDNEEEESGKLVEDWNLLPAKKINDPAQSKPTDWVDVKQIPDPEAKKPADWGKEPEKMLDPTAKKPEDWDAELDGEWTAPMVNNPKYVGEWKHPNIENPAYKGEWKHPQVDNPAYAVDNEVYAFKSIGGLGLEIWQVKAGTVFDDILITDDVAEAKKAGEAVVAKRDAEKKIQDAEAKVAAEKAKVEADKAKAEADAKAEAKKGESKEDL